MKRFPAYSLLLISVAGLAACGDRPFLYANEDTEKPAYAQGGSTAAGAQSRPPLDVPPELRDIDVPKPEQVATAGGTAAKETVAGTAVALDTRLYANDVAVIFSAVVDAMTALNLPVQSVDSPSGTITTDWVREGSNNPNAVAAGLSGIFGGDGVQAVRYRYVVRTFRQSEEGSGEKTRLEIRTIGQAFINRHWVNRPIQRKVSDELFSAVEDRLKTPRP